MSRVGASLPWLIPQKFVRGKEEMLGRKEHQEWGNIATRDNGDRCLHQNPLCRTMQGPPSPKTWWQKHGGFVWGVRSPWGAETELELSAAARQENPYLPQIYYLSGKM